MTPAALSTIILRFIALGVSVYGIVLIASGVITHVEAHQATEKLTALASPFAKVAATLYVVGGGTVLLAAFLYAGSRRLGALIARGV